MKIFQKAVKSLKPSLLITLAIGFLLGQLVSSPEAADGRSEGAAGGDSEASKLAQTSISSRGVAADTALLSFAKYGGSRDGGSDPRGLVDAMGLGQVRAAAANGTHTRDG